MSHVDVVGNASLASSFMLLGLLITLFWLAWFFAPYFIVFLLYICATLQDSLATLIGLLVA
jgi:hypothetical protein